MMKPGQYGPGDGTANGGYRFGYDGKEKDNNGELGLINYDYGARIYNPALGRWLSLDPLMDIMPERSPYHALGNSPNALVDADGRYNIIYLLIARDSNGKALISPEKAKLVAEKANKYFALMGLHTTVVFFDEEKRGHFDVTDIDYSDNVAVIGAPKAIQRTMAQSVSPAFAKAGLGENFLNETGPPNPENSNNRKGSVAVGNRLGIAVSTENALREFRDAINGTLKPDVIESLSIFILHGAGHNTVGINDYSFVGYGNAYRTQGHTKEGIMSDDLIGYLHGIGVQGVLDRNLLENKIYIMSMQWRYGAGAAKDNYESNKAQNAGKGNGGPKFRAQKRYRKE